MTPSVLDSIRTITADVLGLPADRITADTSPQSVENWDSVQHLNLVLAVEQAFGVMFEPEELDQMKSVGQIAGMVEAKRR